MVNFYLLFTLGVFFAFIFTFLLQSFLKKSSGQKKQSFRYFWRFNLFIPMLGGILVMLLFGNIYYIKIFIISALTGAFFEFFIGYLLFKLNGKPAWEYYYLPIGRFTSWLVILYWGWAGLMFVAIANLLK